MSYMELAKIEDLQDLVKMTDQAKIRLKDMGIDQWQKGVPNADTWTDAINENHVYVLKADDGDIMGAFCFALGIDASYDEIDGAWLTGEEANYVAVHRFCVSENHLRKGVAHDLLVNIKRLAKEHELDSIRIDTHEKNIPMQKTINKAGFTKCGITTIKEGADYGAPRISYELLVADII